MIQVNAMGDACPIPLVKTRKAIAELGGPGVVETLVDNEIAVQNLTRMGASQGYAVQAEQREENLFSVKVLVNKLPEKAAEAQPPARLDAPGEYARVLAERAQQRSFDKSDEPQEDPRP